MSFRPGPGVGGHCLPIDPLSLSWQIKQQLGVPFRFVELANDINEQMPDDVDPASPSPGTRVVLDSDEATNPDLMVVLVSHDAFDWNSIDTSTTHVFDATRRISGDLVQHL